MPARILVLLVLAVILAAGLTIAAVFSLGLPLTALSLGAVLAALALRFGMENHDKPSR